MQENHYLVPEQTLGHEQNLEHTIQTNTPEDAEDWFVDAKERLLDVNNWTKYSKGINMDFRLTDAHGKALNRKAHNHDHIRIESLMQQTGFDWVAIEALEYDDYPDEDMETFAMRVRQVAGPGNVHGDIINNATSTIVIERRRKHLTASYHGRNESIPGINDTGNGAWLGLPDIEWAKLIKGLID